MREELKFDSTENQKRRLKCCKLCSQQPTLWSNLSAILMQWENLERLLGCCQDLGSIFYHLLGLSGLLNNKIVSSHSISINLNAFRQGFIIVTVHSYCILFAVSVSTSEHVKKKRLRFQLHIGNLWRCIFLHENLLKRF